ncbi:replication protein B [Yersinia rochesterensis]|uniref:replication protein B n=1 Tax=Yersinia rochesterensis TaxID=1604335 RepID=UPI001F22512B|nr:replication protein B [Yersinia rochesterensis]
MSIRCAFGPEHLRAMPLPLRAVIGKHFAGSRWRDTCNFYDSMPERYRATICFHAELKKRHALLQLAEMDNNERQRIVSALDELRHHFAKYRKHAISNVAFIQRLPISVRKTLFLHAGLSHKEFNQPASYLEEDACPWRETLIAALRELLNLFEDAPDILTAVKPDAYFN